MSEVVQQALSKMIGVELAELIASWPLILSFKLKAGDTAIVAGAYKGKVMEALLELYPGIRVVGFEPQPWAYDQALARLSRFPANQWALHQFGLGDETRKMVPMGEFGTDAASFINVGPQARQQGAGDLVEAGEALAAYGSRFALMVLNMEGYEFRLVRYLITAHWLESIDKLAVQWHLGLGGNGDLEANIGDVDSILNSVGYHRDHRLVYDERPTWTYSERKHRDG